jgi:hypothetical protein
MDKVDTEFMTSLLSMKRVGESKFTVVRSSLVYDARNHAVSFKSVDVINCGAFLTYGGYGAQNGYRPKSDKLYKLVLHGGEKRIETVGFYL